MYNLELMASAYLVICARTAVLENHRSLALYDETERKLIKTREAAALALHREPRDRAYHAARVAAAEIARGMVNRKRRKYLRRMVDRLFAAPERVPRREAG